MFLNRAAQQFADALLADDPVALYDQAPCGYLTTDPDGSILKVNSTFLTLTGYAAEQTLSARFADLLTPGGRIFHETHLAPLLRLQGTVQEIALDLVREDGSRLPVLLNASLDRDPTGAPHLVRIAVFQATERRRYEQELLRATQTAQQAQQDAEAANRRTKVLMDTLQQSLVPRRLPVVDGLELAGAYRPAGSGDEVGGDFYDVFTFRDECWLVLGDVSGKGVEAAVVTALVRNGARSLALSLLDHRREPGLILGMLDHLVEHHETDRFCTAVVARLRRTATGWHLSYASAGHPPALLLDGDGRQRLLPSPGRLLGLGVEAPIEQQEIDLAPGERLLLYTDGVTEARRGGELYGETRLLRLAELASGSQDLVELLVEDVLDFSGQLPRDDVGCLAATVR